MLCWSWKKSAAAPWSHPPSRGGFSRVENDERRSEEHTSELQSLRHLVCRLLLEKNRQSRALLEPHAADATGGSVCPERVSQPRTAGVSISFFLTEAPPGRFPPSPEPGASFP